MAIVRCLGVADVIACIDLAREHGIIPCIKGGGHNFLGADEGEGRLRAAYGGNYDRLAKVKRAWDPENLFRANKNIVPA